MSCLCGDYCCPSCGPAQGNWRCPLCRAWASEGCPHITEDGQALRPEFEAEAEAKAAAEAAYEAEMDARLAAADDEWNRRPRAAATEGDS